MGDLNQFDVTMEQQVDVQGGQISQGPLAEDNLLHHTLTMEFRTDQPMRAAAALTLVCNLHAVLTASGCTLEDWTIDRTPKGE